MISSDCYIEVELIFKNGDKDWVSPITNTDENIRVYNNCIHIDNPYYTYSYDIDMLSKVVANRKLDGEIIESEVLYKFE